MDDNIDQVRTNAAAFVNYLESNDSVECRLALISYGGNPNYDDTLTNYEFIELAAFTDELEEISETVKAYDGNFEYGITAILNSERGAFSLDFDSDAQREFIVVTDEGYYESVIGADNRGNRDSDTTFNYDDIVSALNNNGVKLDVFGERNNDCDVEWEPLANATHDSIGNQGQFYDLREPFSKTFGNLADIMLDRENVVIDLNDASGTSSGVFVISGNNKRSVATLKAVDDVSFDETIVGTVTADHVYEADPNSVRQLITIPDRWKVTSTDKDDNLIVSGSNTTVKGADGADYISIDSNVSTVVLADLDISEDEITLTKYITPGELDPSLNNNQLVFSSTGLTFTLADQSVLTSDIKNYTVHNAGYEHTIADLIYGTDTHRVSLSFHNYGANPTKTYVTSLADADVGYYELTDGEGSRSLWGGVDGDDTLVGSQGYDEFFYCKGNGNDVIENAGDDDLINLLDVSLDDIDLNSFPNAIGDNSIELKFNDGGSLKVNGMSEVGFKVANVDCTFCVKDRQWSVK